MLCECLRRIAWDAAGAAVVCDVSALSADAVAIEAVARLALTARRGGYDLCLRGASRELADLLELCGLSGVVARERAAR